MKRFLYIFLLFAFCSQAQQEDLQVRRVRFNRLKKTEISRGDILEYKLRGESRYRKNEIVGLRDSSIIFGSGNVVNVDLIKALKLHRGGRGVSIVKTTFLYAGVMLVAVDVINNTLVFKRTEVLNKKVGIASLCFLSAALVIDQASIRRIRMNNRNSLKVIDADYFQVN